MLRKKACINSPIRYYGSKGNGLANRIYQYSPKPSDYDVYLEAFSGAANLLFTKKPSGVEIYNDLEKNVYSLFKVLSNKELFPKFKELCELTYYSKDIREEFKIDLKKEDLDVLERAYKYFYVNRTSFNGNGGFSAISESIRRNMSKSVSDYLSSVDCLPEIHDRLSRVIVENSDGIELIEKHDKDRTFIYADPPYHQDTRTGARYKVDMNDEQQERFVSVALNLKKAKILISGYDCKEYNRLTSNGFEKIEMEVNTQDSKRRPKTKTEVLWRNYKEEKKIENGTLWQQ